MLLWMPDLFVPILALRHLFLQNQAKQFEKSELLKTGFNFIENLEIDKSELNDQMDKDFERLFGI